MGDTTPADTPAEASATTTPPPDGPDTGGAPQSSEFTPITSQAEFDKAIGRRLAKFGDYDDLKAKAEQFDRAEAEKKPQLERLNDELAAAKRENEQLRLAQLRSTVAETTGVPASLLSGTTQEEIEASAAALLDFRGAQPAGPVVPAENTNGGAAAPPNDWLGAQLRS